MSNLSSLLVQFLIDLDQISFIAQPCLSDIFNSDLMTFLISILKIAKDDENKELRMCTDQDYKQQQKVNKLVLIC